MRISIVTPSYNQVRYLETTMRSVLDQGYPDLEYMVVDGGSTDGSPAVIDRYASRLAWWVSEKDRGQADAINKGFKRATGDVVAWLNSDDYYLPGALEQCAAAFDRDPDLGLVFGDVLAVDDDGRRINRIRYKDWGLEDLLEFRIIGQPAVFIRRSVLEQAGFLDPTYHFLLDHHLWLRIARIAGMRHISSLLAAARFHAEAKNIAHGIAMSREAFRIADWLDRDPDFTDLAASRKSRIRSGAHCFHAHYLLDGGQPARALREYGLAFRRRPSVALREWRRIMLSILSWAGLGGLRAFILRWRKAHSDGN